MKIKNLPVESDAKHSVISEGSHEQVDVPAVVAERRERAVVERDLKLRLFLFRNYDHYFNYDCYDHCDHYDCYDKLECDNYYF